MRLLMTVALLVGSLTAFAQNPIDGEWKGTRDTPNGALEITYKFTVEGSTLKGVSITQFGEIEIKDGKVDGKKFSYTITYNEMTINNTGELINNDEILIKNERGDMKMTRVKK